MLLNLLQISCGSMLLYAVVNPQGFFVACLCGVTLGVGLWFLCIVVARNWNRSYRLLPAQHILCSFAAVWTLFFCVAFVSVTAVDGYFERLVDGWDPAMAGGSLLSSLQDFEAEHPFVRNVLNANGSDSAPLSEAEASQSNSSQAVETVKVSLKDELRDHVDWAVFRLRLFLFFSFLLLQASTFGLVGFAAHRDIRPVF